MPDDARVDYIKQEADKDLKEEGFLFKSVSGEKASAAVDALKSLPPDLPGKAIEKLDRGAFDRMLGSYEFRAKAQRASTPEQIDPIEQGY